MALVKFYKTPAKAKTAAKKLRALGFRAFVTMDGKNVRRGVFLKNRKGE